ncbi:MAG: hypothetical protein Q9225_003611 [Loekoesia sp. 1 TL-2023]
MPAISPFIPNLDEPTAAQHQNEPYLDYYTYLLSLPNSKLPQVISNSYGEDEQTVPPAYATHVCNMIGQLGLHAISVLESSGHTGIGAPCQSNDGKRTPQSTPQFPGTCPPDYAVYTNNAFTRSGRTSAAWSAFAGVVTLLNDARLAKGLKPLGFSNPFLYRAGTTGLTDITRSGSRGRTGVNAQTGATLPGASIIPYAS